MKWRENCPARCAALAFCVLAILALTMSIGEADAEEEGVEYILTVSDWAYVREEPRKSSLDLGRVDAGQVVRGIGYQDGWVQVAIDFERKSGWIRADLLTLTNKTTGRYTNISGGRARIRRTPDVNDDAKTNWLEAGKKITVTRWLYADGAEWAVTDKGYIKSDCLEVSK